jgi:hypothetical protein
MGDMAFRGYIQAARKLPWRNREFGIWEFMGARVERSTMLPLNLVRFVLSDGSVFNEVVREDLA